MTDAGLAAISVEIERLRDSLPDVRQAAVLVLVDGKVYLSLKVGSKEEGQRFLGAGFIKALVQGGLTTQEEIDSM